MKAMPMSRRHIIILLAFLLPVAVAGAPVSDGVRFRNITMENGLLANTVRNVVQDDDGFIWLGTDNGLCRYDGVEVRPFRILENGVDQYVSCMLAVSGGLYVGTDHGAFYFDFTTEAFQHIIPAFSGSVSSFCADKDGCVWLTALADSVICYRPETRQVMAYANPVSGPQVSKIFVDGNNQVWLYAGSRQGMLHRFNKATGLFQEVATDLPEDHTGCYAMTQTSDGALWLGTWVGGLYRIDEDGRGEQYLNPQLSMVGMHIHELYELPDHHLLICCDDGLIDYNLQDRSWVRISDPDHSGAISNRFVYSALSDAEGGLWFSTFYGGVNYVSPVSARFASFQNREGEWGLQGSVIGRFCEDARGRIWIASDDGGLNCFKGGHGSAFLDFPGRQQLLRLNIHALCMDGDDLWIGTYSDGVLRMNVNTGRTVRFSVEQGLDGSSCYAIYRDQKGRIWASTMQGICVYDRTTSTFQHLKDVGALTIDIDEDAQGTMWFSTQGGGIWRYDPDGERWRNYRHQADDVRSLPDDQVNCLCITSDRQLWVGTESGFCLYDSSSDSFVTQLLDTPSADVRSIVEDGQYLWLSTSKGIVRYNKQRDVLIFNKYDGLVSEQFQPNAGLKASDGRIYFGSVRGFNAFYPYQIHVNNLPPRVFVTGLKIYNKEIPVGQKPLAVSPSHLSQLDLSYHDDMFSLSFASLSYCSPEKNQYAYMLEGFDKSWNYCGNRSEASYTNVPSGTYTFRVRATNNDGIWSAEEARLKIVVHPPFWLSWPAKVLYVILGLLAIYGYTYLRLRTAERRHRKELQDVNDQAEADVRDARLRFFTMIAHEIRTPVSLIIGPLESLKSMLNGQDDKAVAAPEQAVGSSVRQESPQKPVASSLLNSLDIIDRNAHRLLTLVNQLLDFNKVQQEGFSMHFAEHAVASIMQAVAERFEPTLQQQGIRFDVVYPAADFKAEVDEEGLTKVISNLMANAAKYTKDVVRLSCQVSASGERFSIVVEDNGAGVGEADKQKIFDAFYQARDNKPGTGIGLSIVKTIVEEHHGTVIVKSEEGQGARFVVTLPVVQNTTLSGVGHSTPRVGQAGEPAGHSTPLPLREGQGESLEGLSTSSVLIVEDDADMLAFLAGHFAKTYTVLTAANGREGLEQLRRQEVSLIVSDWMMPEMDGAELCRRLRSNRETSHIPLLMLTAKTDDDSKVEGMNIGADAYIEKPFSLKYLDAAIRNMITRRHELLQRFSQSPDEPIGPLATNAVDDEFLTRMNSIIEANVANSDLSVGFLAEQMNMSRSGLFAKIKGIADVTPNEMIQIVRLKRAAQLLAEGKYRINEVSYMVGFSSPSYFTKCFRKQFGKKPGEMIKP